MIFTKTEIEGLLIIEPSVFRDARGHFLEFYNANEFISNGIPSTFVQDNLSVSKKGVIRGLHFQEEPYAQGKLVRVTSGAALDVAVDLRKDSSSFGQSFCLELNAENNKMLWIPAGFAHGFEALSDDVTFVYKVTQYYNKHSEKGLVFNDSDLNIKWRTNEPIVSEKDLLLPMLKDYLVKQ